MKIKIIKKRVKKKNLRKNLMLAGLSAALLSQPIMAEAKKWTFHEGKWKDVKAYGRTPISEDSAREWGPWTEFIQPAAGPIPVAALPQITTDGPSYFRPESANEYSPKYTQVAPEGLCQGGGWCGYAAYVNYNWEYAYDEYEYYEWDGLYPGRFGLTLSPADGGEGGNASWRLNSLFGAPNPNYGESGEMEGWWYNNLGDFWANRYTETDGTYDYAWACGGSVGECGWYYYYYDDDIPTEYVTVGWFSRYSGQYMNGDGGEGWKGSQTYGPFVAGISTPLTDIANLQAGNVIANYSGSTSGWWGGSSPVNITVNFGPGTWSGSWNNGSDGSTWTYTDSSGQLYVYGQVGFNAEGTISGANIQSTSVSTADPGATVSGLVQGSFFGPDAGALGGVADITKSNPTGGLVNGENGEYGYTDARYVDVFVTTKESD